MSKIEPLPNIPRMMKDNNVFTDLTHIGRGEGWEEGG
jgi:hypothetical protein